MTGARHRLSLTVRTEGGLLPADFLARVAANDRDVPGLTPEAYHLDRGDRLGEAITRSWNRLVGAWATLRDERERLGSAEHGTGLTRERWLLPLFDELGYGRLVPTRAVELDGRTYPISHAWGAVPIHLVGVNVPLDRRTAGVPGAAERAPHGLVQDLLNRSDERLWGFVSNGLVLRVLRDNAALTRQAFVEFDLEAIFEGEAYADFTLLWLVCHQSRLEGERPPECYLEGWTKTAAEAGSRALDSLRGGVEAAITALGSGFLAHPANGALRAALREGTLDRQDYYRELLRLVYRLLFVFTAEDRGLLLDPAAESDAAERYTAYYSTGRLRRLAERHRGTRHGDLWAGLRVVFGALGSDDGAPGLGLPALGGFLFGPEGGPHLDAAELANRDLLEAVRSLALLDAGRTRVDYRNLGSEELGSVYESLLELHPELDATAASFTLRTASGHERKTTGSYYTPTSLINVLLDSALDPVLAEAAAKRGREEAERAILELRVVDPAAGSGHFLVAAAHRIAKRLAAVRTGEDEPSPAAVRTALRDVIGRCIYAVDVNPMAVELCKVSLWLEALEPGKPLSFLDAHIKCGNSLLGTTPELVAEGIPDAAYEPIAGDDRAVARALKARNRAERDGQQSLSEAIVTASDGLAASFDRFASLPDAIPKQIQKKQRFYRELVDSALYRDTKFVADAWCAAFLGSKVADGHAITSSLLRLASQRSTDYQQATAKWVLEIASRERLFHWYVEFPDVLQQAPALSATAEQTRSGGFDVVLGNPPWISYSGRQTVQFDPRELSLLKCLVPAISRWPSTHSAFLVRAASLVRDGGAVGLVLPFQVALLEGYREAREAVTQRAKQADAYDVGEESFPGVSQRAGIFSIRVADAAEGGEWIVRQQEQTNSNGEGTAGVEDAATIAELVRNLEARPRFPPKTFTDPGVHTGNVGKLIVSDGFPDDDAKFPPIREGKDLSAFHCGPPRKRLWSKPDLHGDQYCRIGTLDRYAGTPILLRQTADRPIACRHVERTYFRNSILACAGIQGIADEVVVAVLNSTLIATYYRATVLDSAQLAFPQVKVRNLHTLPMFSVELLSRSSSLSKGMNIEQVLVDLVHQLESSDPHSVEWTALLGLLDQVVLELYELDGEGQPPVSVPEASLAAMTS